jgi:hypothetical protein
MGQWIEGGLPFNDTFDFDDFAFLADMGANSVRIPFNNILFEDGSPEYRRGGWEKLDEIINWAAMNKLLVILDMHAFEGYTKDQNWTLWADSSLTGRIKNLWAAIAKRYKDNTMVAGYDLMNEPIARGGNEEKYYALIRDVISAIRSVDQNHIVFVESLEGGSPAQFKDALLTRDGNAAYSFHFYTDKISDHRSKMQSAIDFANRNGVPVYVGEFGMVYGSKGESPSTERAWYQSVTDLCRENRFQWSVWQAGTVDTGYNQMNFITRRGEENKYLPQFLQGLFLTGKPFIRDDFSQSGDNSKGAVIFDDFFDSAATGQQSWNLGDGFSVTPDDRYYLQNDRSTDAVTEISAGSDLWTDYTLELTLNISERGAEGASYASVVTRYKNGAGAEFLFRGGGISYKLPGAATEIPLKDMLIYRYRNYRVKIVCAGSKITLYLDGAYIGEFDAETSMSGKIAMRTWKMMAGFDDVTVRDTNGNVIFTERFDPSSVNPWQASGGSWTVSPNHGNGRTNVLVGKTSGQASASISDPSCANLLDFSINAQFKLAEEKGSNAYASFDFRNNCKAVVTANGIGCAINGGAPIALLDYSFEFNRWYSIELTLRGNSGTVYIDGKYVGKLEGLPYSRGTVGVSVNNLYAKFDNIQIKSLWNGLDGINWAIEQNSLKNLYPYSESTVYAGDAAGMSDYTIEAEVKAGAGENGGWSEVNFRLNPNGERAGIRIAESGLVYVRGDTQQNLAYPGFALGVWHTLKITVSGTTVSVYIDGALVGGINDAGLPRTGAAGFSTTGMALYINSVKVSTAMP